MLINAFLKKALHELLFITVREPQMTLPLRSKCLAEFVEALISEEP